MTMWELEELKAQNRASEAAATVSADAAEYLKRLEEDKQAAQAALDRQAEEVRHTHSKQAWTKTKREARAPRSGQRPCVPMVTPIADRLRFPLIICMGPDGQPTRGPTRGSGAGSTAQQVRGNGGSACRPWPNHDLMT